MEKTPRPRRSRQLRSSRRRHILRLLERERKINPLQRVTRGGTVWLFSPEMAHAKEQLDALKSGV